MKRTSIYRALRTAVALGAVSLSSGCAFAHGSMLDPQGPIALAERNLLFTAVALMLIVVIPVFVMAFLFAWRYRSSNGKARYTPKWSYSPGIDALIWVIPALIVGTLGVLLWSDTHDLDPYRRIDSAIRPLEVEAVAEDWKWLFIYPEQNIAVVNELVFPSQTPLSLKLTSDTVMNAFFIPALGSQIYAMAGMQTRLNLLADAPGHFMGKNTQFSGSGFPDQHFEAIALSKEDFDAWVAKVKKSPNRLDAAAYRVLAKPSSGQPVTYYSSVEPKLFDKIIAKYTHNQTRAAQSVTQAQSVNR